MSDIQSDSASNYTNVQKYEFEKLDVDENSDLFDANIFKSDETKETQEEEPLDEVKQEEITPPDDFLEKLESLTSEVVALQMELENEKKSHQELIESSTNEAYEKGKEEGIKEINDTIGNENDELKSQLIRSITQLQETTSKIDAEFTHIEEDLIESAILIAQKVIKKEVEEDSSKVAKSIAKALIGTLKETTNLSLKVNPNDFKELSEHFNADSIMIVADDAVSRGGVIILSDTTNIDATITTRLNKAMELIGKE